MRNATTVYFKNPICSYAPNLCKADDSHRCKPIELDPGQDWSEWARQAHLRAQHCGYRGIKLAAIEIATRRMALKKANSIKYLEEWDVKRNSNREV